MDILASGVTQARDAYQLKRHAGIAKRRALHTRHLKFWVGLWVEKFV
jgi:hypothetical protein